MAAAEPALVAVSHRPWAWTVAVERWRNSDVCKMHKTWIRVLFPILSLHHIVLRRQSLRCGARTLVWYAFRLMDISVSFSNQTIWIAEACQACEQQHHLGVVVFTSLNLLVLSCCMHYSLLRHSILTFRSQFHMEKVWTAMRTCEARKFTSPSWAPQSWIHSITDLVKGKLQPSLIKVTDIAISRRDSALRVGKKRFISCCYLIFLPQFHILDRFCVKVGLVWLRCSVVERPCKINIHF